ncbi:YdcF family protein [Asticcacaulis sp. BYS171W]|uniref:YdcF family protein n=1 Tax=Asticcacaulis aquaticus TaxID=2984212 RepID=A0ABT5HST5_9CAUL|nr:YdcF family protein [Asticcacaulis aquaticus]MDC7683133.1 YdcF family protein [Asticcacaulis aquaticus]
MRRLVAVLLIVVLWAAGLLAFADRVIDSTPASEPDQAADAIVVLTGASDMRIKEGMRLLERRKGTRMLISGVNREVTRDELLTVTEGNKRLYECCVDLGYEAQTTLGNAHEVAEWAKAKGFKDLIVVTSDYHMPRSLLEIKATLPGATLHPYPVATPSLDARAWWKSGSGSRTLVIEYSKYLAILGRDMLLSVKGLFSKDKPETDGAPDASAEGSAS